MFSFLFAAHPINIDGLFQDWENVPILYQDSQNDALEADFYNLKVTYDNNFIFIYFNFYSDEFLLQNWNDFHLYIDADNDSLTGYDIQGIGAELEWNFGSRNGYKFFNGEQTEIYQNDLTLRIAPTITSAEFEIAIQRECSVLTLNGSQSLNIGKIFISEIEGGGDFLPNELGGVPFSIGEDTIFNPEPIELERINENDIRLVSYNTWNEGIIDENRRLNFKRILQAIDPDIIALQEHSEWEQIENIIQSWFPDEQWNASWTYNDLVVLSRFSIINDSNMGSGRTMTVLLNTEDEYGKNLLIFNSHLSCCDNDESRQEQVDIFAQEWKEWIVNGIGPFELEYETPFMHVGDFNFVGYRKQVETIRIGDIENENQYGFDFLPDWDLTPILVLFPRHTHKRMGYTWRNDESSFNPGKLDYIFYSDATIDSGRNYILNTLSMDNSSLSFHQLQSHDTKEASDHLPIVFDIIINEEANISKDYIFAEYFMLYPSYPNPFNLQIQFKFSLLVPLFISVKIIDIKGNEIITIYSGKKGIGDHYLSWDGRNKNGLFSGSGVYFILYQGKSWSKNQKVILLK